MCDDREWTGPGPASRGRPAGVASCRRAVGTCLRLLGLGVGLFIFSVGILGGLACEGGEQGGVELARVGDKVLTLDEIWALTSRQEGGDISAEEKRELVRQWVDTEVLYRQAIRDKLHQDVRIRQALKQMEKELLAAELMDRRVGREKAIDNREIEQYYASHQNNFILSEPRVRARHILLDSAEKARDIGLRLSHGASFEALVKEASLDSYTIGTGGDLGFFFADEIAPEISRVAFNLTTNEISRPIRTEQGYHIIQVTEVQPKGSLMSFEEVKTDIANTLFALKQRQAFDTVIKELKDNEDIDIHWERIDSAIPAREAPVR